MIQALFAPRRFLTWWAVFSILLLAGGGVARAQTQADAGARVEIQAVRFGEARGPGGGASWTEVTVDLRIVSGTDGGTYARWADAVRVALSLAVRKRTGDYEFFRAAAEAVSLEAGRAAFRFYLPPEIARREQLTSGEPYAWFVEVTGSGQPGLQAASTLLSNAEAVRSFKDRVARDATRNDGVLVPQSQSPFATAYAGETPTFVRR